MKIGLLDIDSKIPNLALMKISAFHKQHHDLVKWWNAFESFDKIYGSKIFKSSTFSYLPKNIIMGGSGIDLTSKLSDEIEHIYPDYSLYKIDYAMGYLTRGCNNACPFCIVHKKEGFLHHHAQLEEFWKDQSKIMLLDNSLTDFDCAMDLWKIIDYGLQLNLCQGFNIRTIKPEIAMLLAKIKLWKGKQWKIAWDNFLDKERVLNGIKILNNTGIKNYQIMCYVLVGYNSTKEQDLERITILDKLDLDPFVMPYTKTDYTQKLARWCNRPQIRHSCSFQDYSKGEFCKVS